MGWEEMRPRISQMTQILAATALVESNRYETRHTMNYK